MEATLIIAAIVQVITLIVFFVMASNVARIKKLVARKSAGTYFDMAMEEKYLGNKEKAREYFLRAKYRYEVTGEYFVKDGQEYFGGEGVKEVEKQLAEL